MITHNLYIDFYGGILDVENSKLDEGRDIIIKLYDIIIYYKSAITVQC